MCGVVGFTGFDIDPQTYPARIEAMLRAVRHRGPDELGLYWDERIGLGSARLTIIDRSSGGQPMSAGCGRHWIVFNGEIFNYVELRAELESQGERFVTRSDTEVLLVALVRWGTAALSRLNGQFAFAWYDRFDGRLVLARDRFGERPLFYWHDRGRFAFASEIKALLTLREIPRGLDPDGLRQVCQFWTTLPESTCFAGVRSVLPGFFGVFERGRWRLERYFALPGRTDARAATWDPTAAAAAVRGALDRAVELRLRSDVEVALLLSGGLDSTIVAALAQRRAGRPLRSYSVSFEDADFDESAYQTEAAARLGTRPVAVTVARRDIRDHLPPVVRQAETALVRTAPVPLYLLAQRIHADGIKVVLTGEGADELFLGYDIFKEALFFARFDQMADDGERLAALSRLYPYLGHFSAQQARALLQFYRPFAAGADGPLRSHGPRFANGTFAARLIAGVYDVEQGRQALHRALVAHYPDLDRRDAVDRAQAIEVLTLLNGYLLSSQGDRMAAAHSLEGRYPFLDHEVAALSCSLPRELLLTDGWEEKHILKRAFADLLPPAIAARAKQPYRAPGAVCLLRATADDWVPALLSDSRIAASSVLEPSFARALIAQVERIPDDKISPRVDQAYVALVTILLLEDMLAQPFTDEASAIALSRRIDGRSLAAPRRA